MADPTQLHSVSKANNSSTPPHHRHHKETHGRSDDIDENTDVEDVKGPNVFERVKEEMEAIVQAVHPKKESNVKAREIADSDSSHQHHHETHGRCDDIDETTSVDEVKGPGVFERIKEEVEAVVEAVHPKKKDSTGSN